MLNPIGFEHIELSGALISACHWPKNDGELRLDHGGRPFEDDIAGSALPAAHHSNWNRHRCGPPKSLHSR